MSRTVSDVIIETLIDLGIRRIYGLPGDSLNPLVDSIRRHDDKIEFIQVRHEEGAALAASFESKLTGKVTVCMGTSGPGSIHLLNGLYDAKMDHASVIALTGQVETDLIGTDYFQEVKLDSLFADVSVYSTTIMSPERSQSLVLRAHREALMRKGVSHLTLPADVLRLQSDEPENVTDDFYPVLKFNPDLGKVNDAINQSKKPVILIGKGARNCGPAVEALSEKIGAPIIYALNGKGIVDDLDRKVMGSLGLLGTRPSYDAMKKADLLIMMGSSYPYIQFIPEDLKTIQVDIDPNSIGKRRRSDIPVISDTGQFLERLNVAEKPEKYFMELQDSKKSWIEALEKAEKSDEVPMKPEVLAAAISRHADRDADIIVDTGNVTVWGVRNFRTNAGRRFTYSSWLGSMGIGIPGSVGASYASDKQVIALIGDGSFAMTMMELVTIKKYNRPVKLFVFNNSKLGMIKFEEEVMGFPEYGVDLQPLDFAKIAASIGIHSIRVEKPGDLDKAVAEALSRKGEPSVVDVVVSSKEAPMPPKLQFEQIKGYVTSLLREKLD